MLRSNSGSTTCGSSGSPTLKVNSPQLNGKLQVVKLFWLSGRHGLNFNNRTLAPFDTQNESCALSPPFLVRSHSHLDRNTEAPHPRVQIAMLQYCSIPTCTRSATLGVAQPLLTFLASSSYLEAIQEA
ncbi:hypothetical protein AGABI1DRAFT_135119 [Agaricus bisporus var. burnettii JB137-S8]|uniref:Uncharacterized protein n=1 Tax=Agaricus bisporus var. burnettii (strain JB137-S8 / ATCC MYA-4627 / FGSC 10392) TaxID=597362 RepID=K5WRB4_AGABU|nr:uncharacterized protein AGABI1DRAFT_135119 [Agaricus bisporus var. burnettii JB137-S8]EKM73298.1 hypothetical protein AGABI1DRAFT_135119 [Agaricus bisporus var. burnettii JB137-S8]